MFLVVFFQYQIFVESLVENYNEKDIICRNITLFRFNLKVVAIGF